MRIARLRVRRFAPSRFGNANAPIRMLISERRAREKWVALSLAKNMSATRPVFSKIGGTPETHTNLNPLI